MPLAPGDRLGHYKILTLVGKGGMGEVYRALDTKLDREVAVKVLPALLAGDPERLARFEREAKVLASLNHPNIAQIFGVEEGALVMELVEGESPAGPLAFDEAWKIMAQVADGLEYAHERRVVHRDLKPANLKVTPEGRVKILDFGLAKALSPEPRTAAAAGSDSPTLTMGATQAGVILGTAAYMAPEQIKGKEADRRADIWAFGVVFYELLTGERPFKGKDSTEIMAHAVTSEPEFDKAPVKVRRLLGECLKKEPEERLRWVGDVARFLDVPSAAAAPAASLPRHSWYWPAFAAFIVLALMPANILHFREQPPDPPKPVRFQLSPESRSVGGSFRFALSPDGTKLAYFASGGAAGNAPGIEGSVRLWIRSLDTLESRALPATDLRPTVPIFWSFDSRFVVFQTPDKLKKIDISGGPAQTLCDVTGTVVGGSWNRDGVIVFGKNNGPLMRVSAEGGIATEITTLDSARGESAHVGPVFLPDGRHFLYGRGVTTGSRGTYIGFLDDKLGQPTPKPLLASDYTVEFVPTPEGDSGKILFLREGTLLAQSLDLRKLELTGEAVPVAEQVATLFGVGQFSASQNGALVYRSGSEERFARLTWFDRKGNNLGSIGDADYSTTSLTFSPDGSRMAAMRTDGRNSNLWLLDLARGGQTRFTFSQGSIDAFATWSPDGARIAFSSSRAGHFDIYQHAANGAGEDELLFKSANDKYVDDWSRDGRFLMFSETNSRAQRELWALPMSGDGDRKPIPYLRTNFDQREGRFSPDGRWVAYRSNESGRTEIYVRPFPPPPGGGGKWMVSRGGPNDHPRWRRDGKELFYVTLDGQLMASEVNANGAAFQPGTPKLLFKGVATTAFEVSADGTKFLFPVVGSDTTQYPFTVVLNWTGLLKK